MPQFTFDFADFRTLSPAMFAGIALSSALALTAFTAHVNAHGYLKEPKPSWKDSPNPGWVALVDNYWDIGSGGDQCGAFKTMASQKGMSVKDVVLDMVKGQSCGNTLADGAAQPIPSDGKVKWLGNGGGGFTHVGPCEVYLDDKMVVHGDNCEDEFKGGGVGSTETSDIPVDYSACNGKCTLTIYWLAFQNAQWQAYVNCVPLSGSGGSTTQTEGSQTSSQSTETSTTQGSSTEEGGGKSTEKDSPSTEQSSNQAPSPEEQEQAPSTEQKTTEAPSSEQQQNQSSTEQKQTQPPSSEQEQNQTPAPQQEQQNQTPAPQQEEQKQTPSPQQEQNQTPAPQQEQQNPTPAPQQEQQNQTPAPQQQEQNQTPAPQQQQQQNQTPLPVQQQQQQQQQTPAPGTEQRSLDFNNLNGGTGTVQPPTNLRK